ncbi:MAG TPA: serine protease [Polyangiales bacterium]|nr:serine protease [Polyangiales bacterium]
MSESIIYDADDRHDVYAEPDPRLRAIAEQATAAIVLRSEIAIDASGAVSLGATSAQDTYDLCADEPFAAQPSAALCTAVLVAPDIALTAGHCLTWMSCPRLALVFGFNAPAPDQLGPLHASDVYGCAEVLALEVSQPGVVPARDYGFVRLERPVDAPRQPVQLTREPAPAAGTAVVAIGHGAGLPVKIAGNGLVTDSRAATGDYFLANVDNYGAGSGSGVYDAHGRLIGLATGGGADFALAPEGCSRSRHVAGDLAAGEKVGNLAPMLAGLCAEASASELCGQHVPTSGCGVSDRRAVGHGGTLAALLVLVLASTWWCRRARSGI